MTDVSFFQENKEVIIVLTSIFIGWLLNVLQNYFNNKREDKLYVQRKREELYIRLMQQYENLSLIKTDAICKANTSETFTEASEILAGFYLYFSDKNYNELVEIIGGIIEADGKLEEVKTFCGKIKHEIKV